MLLLIHGSILFRSQPAMYSFIFMHVCCVCVCVCMKINFGEKLLSSFRVGRIIFQKPFKFYYQISDESHRKSFHAPTYFAL